jgi:hypothetical protein
MNIRTILVLVTIGLFAAILATPSVEARRYGGWGYGPGWGGWGYGRGWGGWGYGPGWGGWGYGPGWGGWGYGPGWGGWGYGPGLLTGAAVGTAIGSTLGAPVVGIASPHHTSSNPCPHNMYYHSDNCHVACPKGTSASGDSICA